MSRYPRRANKLVSSLLIVGSAIGISMYECSPPASVKSEEIVDSGEFAEPLFSLPQSGPFVKQERTPADDQQQLVGIRVALMPLQILRAHNLSAAGHFEEALADFREGLPKWKVPIQIRRGAEIEFAIACQQVGKIDDAIEHAKLAGADEFLAELYLKERRFAEAKAVADKNVLYNRVCEFRNQKAIELAPWLQRRAVVEYHLKQYDNAVRDFKEAAQRYSEEDAEGSNTCMRAANVLIARFKMGSPFKLEAAKLPAKGKEKVIELVKFLTTSAKPLDSAELSRITGAQIKLPSKPWRNIYQEEKEILPFIGLEYRSDDDDLKVPKLFMFNIATAECCVPKADIDSLRPSNCSKIPPISTWTESDESRYAEAWKLPTGRLFLQFAEGGYRVLEYLEFNAPAPDEKVTIEQLKRRANSYWQENEKKANTLTDAINLDGQRIELYLDRANAYCDLRRFDKALADVKRAVELGGRFYLDEQSMVEEKMGDLGDAIEHFKVYIGEHTPGPETASRYTRLAELYLKNKQFRDALGASEKALIDSKCKGAALFVKAQAEAELGDLESARVDAKAAVDDHFNRAEIVLRDRVLEWLKTIPSSQSR